MVPAIAFSQLQLATFGTRFVFSIPEDASQIGSVAYAGKIVLHVLSAYDGSGILSAPGNFRMDFTFSANTLREIELPRTLMHGRSEGKERIGIGVETSAPVNLVLHDILEFAGESTQILPVEGLGKDYVVASWGLYDDLQENNHAQITITPVFDETGVTITPSVRTIGGISKDSTFTMLLHRGDSYTLKADRSSAREQGLSGTRIHSTAPISVMTSVTCAYVPLGVQACNMLLDHLLPFDFAGAEFFASPLGDTMREAFLVFTAQEKKFTVTLSDGQIIQTTTGRAVAQIERPVKCLTSAPALCHLLTPGIEIALVSDPSIVTILPVQYYQDSMLWQTPRILTSGMPFFHTVNVILPASDTSLVLLDGKPISSQGASALIVGTNHAVTQVVLQPGIHKLKCPSPVFAVASGFFNADAYSFLPMGIGAPTLAVQDDRDAEDDLIVEARPNPPSKQLMIEITGADSNIELTVFDALGHAVISAKGSPDDLRTLDIGNLPSGSYLLEITTGTHRGRTRFVIAQ